MVFIAAAFLASGLIATVSAGGGHALHRNLHKRGVEHSAPAYGAAPSYASTSDAPPVYLTKTTEEVCVPTTYTTTWYGQGGLVPKSTTSVPPPPPPTSYATPTTTSTPPPPPPTTTSTTSTTSCTSTSSAPVYSAPVYSSSAPAYSSPSSSPASYSSGGSSGSISPSGNKWAMTYTPYDTNGGCKSASDVASDIASIASKGFSTVRLYATDCNGIENVGAACKTSGMNMIMGIYIDASGLGNAYAQLDELTAWGQSNGWGNVEMVVAGNEAVFNGYCSASDLAGFIGDVRTKFQAAGYNGPVTTTEPLGTIQENASTFCGAVDVIAANIHPFFNGGVAAIGAGAFVASQMTLLSAACGGAKDAYNLETGWPSEGDANGAAIPSASDQQIAIDSIVAVAGSKSAIFSFENDMWKAPGSLGVEQYWGCASLFN